MEDTRLRLEEGAHRDRTEAASLRSELEIVIQKLRDAEARNSELHKFQSTMASSSSTTSRKEENEGPVPISTISTEITFPTCYT